MANVEIFRGGTADFKPMFCRGDWSRFTPPFSAPHYEDTPPYNSHACAAYGQGWLNLQFPFIPNLQNNDAHKWMREALREVRGVGDIIRYAWVPLRSYLQAQHFEVVRGDPMLDGVFIKPIAERCSWNIAKREWEWKEEAAYATALGSISQFPLGTPEDGDQLWGFAKLDDLNGAKAPCTFGHNMVKVDDKGVPTEGLDEFYGGVVLGFQIADGAAEKIAELWRANFAFYTSAKLSAFECGIQVG